METIDEIPTKPKKPKIPGWVEAALIVFGLQIAMILIALTFKN